MSLNILKTKQKKCVYVTNTPKILAELLRPMSAAFTELWLDGEKAATVEWRKDVDAVPGLDVDQEMVADNGRGIVLDHPVEPLYGDIYMPRELLLHRYGQQVDV